MDKSGAVCFACCGHNNNNNNNSSLTTTTTTSIVTRLAVLFTGRECHRKVVFYFVDENRQGFVSGVSLSKENSGSATKNKTPSPRSSKRIPVLTEALEEDPRSDGGSIVSEIESVRFGITKTNNFLLLPNPSTSLSTLPVSSFSFFHSSFFFLFHSDTLPQSSPSNSLSLKFEFAAAAASIPVPKKNSVNLHEPFQHPSCH